MPASSRSPPVSLESLEHPHSPRACTTAEVSGSSPPSHTTDIDHRNYPHSDAHLLDATCATDTPYYSYPDVVEGDIDDIISTSTRDHTPSAEPQSATIDFNSISPSTRDHTPCTELQSATIDFEPPLSMEGHFEDIISTSTQDHTPCADPPATIDLHSPLPGGANRDTVRRCSYGCQDERLLLYDAVHATKLPNFMQCRTPLPSPLNIHQWRYYLSDYKDNIVCDFMEFGWPIGYMSPALPQSILQNHASSLAYPAHVDHFIDTELKHGALIGPFPQTHPPFTHVATSPLMSRPKKNSEHRRIIMDFSFPIGHAVNSGIPKDTYLGLPYKLHYPTIDDYVRLILNHGPGCFLYKVDLARAFRMLPADPLDYPLLGIYWNDQLYIDTAIGFGLRTGSMACQRVTNAIGYIMGTFYGATTLQYVDDCVGVEADKATASAAYGNLRNVVAELGLQEAPDKLCPPSPRMEFIGVTFDTVTGTISIPGEKVKEIMALVRDWQGRTSATKHQLQSLLGKLHHVAKCVKPARLFVSRMLDTLRSAPDRGRFMLDDNFQRDLQWFANFLPSYNGRNLMEYAGIDTTDLCLEVDACLTGVGGVFEHEFYHASIPSDIPLCQYHITHLEFLNILIAVKVWKHRFTGHHVRVNCDNMASVYVLNSGRSRYKFLLKCAREIWLLAATHDFNISAVHVSSQANARADALSRVAANSRHLDRFANMCGSEQYTRVDVDPYMFKLMAVLWTLIYKLHGDRSASCCPCTFVSLKLLDLEWSVYIVISWYVQLVMLSFCVAVVDDFASLNSAMRRRKKCAYRRGTSQNHMSMFRTYLVFCLRYKLQDINPEPLTLCLYIEFLTRTFQSHRSILNYLSGVRTLHKLVGSPCAAIDSYDVHLMQRAIALTLDRSLPQRQPITLDILYQLLNICDITEPHGAIYRCIFTMAFFGMLRLSNLVPSTSATFNVRENLCAADVWEHPPGLVIMSRWSKTRQHRGQTHYIALPQLAHHPTLCPVRAYRLYLAQVPSSGARAPMFRTPDGRTVTQPMVREALRVMLRCAGYAPALLTFHGLRKGGAQLCYSLGINVEHIKAHGGWASDCVWDYIAPGRYVPSPHVPSELARRLVALDPADPWWELINIAFRLRQPC